MIVYCNVIHFQYYVMKPVVCSRVLNEEDVITYNIFKLIVVVVPKAQLMRVFIGKWWVGGYNP